MKCQLQRKSNLNLQRFYSEISRLYLGCYEGFLNYAIVQIETMRWKAAECDEPKDVII
jgi:hypothetical protein